MIRLKEGLLLHSRQDGTFLSAQVPSTPVTQRDTK